MLLHDCGVVVHFMTAIASESCRYLLLLVGIVLKLVFIIMKTLCVIRIKVKTLDIIISPR